MNLLVTAGPTREFLDPVRFLSNPSSGRMGYAVAKAARARGHDVKLVSGPVSLPCPGDVDRTMVVSASEMLDAVRARLDWCDVLVMTAAVADWRPKEASAIKLKKGQTETDLALVRTPDILTQLRPGKGGRIFIGFAAETGDPVLEARRKLEQKGLDLVVANNVLEPGSGFEGDTNRVTLVGPDGFEEALPMLGKDVVAEAILDWIAQGRGAKA